jgi:serine/threonine protein kinase
MQNFRTSLYCEMLGWMYSCSIFVYRYRLVQLPHFCLFFVLLNMEKRDTSKTSSFTLWSEYCNGGSLYDLLHERKETLSTQQQLEFALKIAEGMEYLHTRKDMVVHRDLKSHNILVKSLSFFKSKPNVLLFWVMWSGSVTWRCTENLWLWIVTNKTTFNSIFNSWSRNLQLDGSRYDGDVFLFGITQ